MSLSFRLLILAAWFLVTQVHAEGIAGKRPNIVFILADDLGFEAVGAYGAVTYQRQPAAVKTPNIDALARNGMLFKYCFSTPVCSPARSEFLTGKYNFRTGFIDIAGRNGAVSILDAKAHPTLAATLKASGYVTAVMGKWHLGPPASMEEIPTTSEKDTDAAHVRDCGFDRQCILGGAHLELYGAPRPGEYTPERMHQWALRFLESRKGKPEPFFLYYASPIPHVPLYPTPLNPEGKKDNGKKQRSDPSNFPYLIQYLDQQVGEVVAKLEALGMRENTLILFSGDNGTQGELTRMRDGREIRGGKGTMLDTGSWVPLVASWPGKIKPGSEYGGLVDFTDLMPTCLELAGAPIPPGLDGISFAPHLLGQPGKIRDWVHVLYVDKYFVRDAHWKLRENGALYDVRNSPYLETVVPPAADTAESKTAREHLQTVLNQLHKQ